MTAAPGPRRPRCHSRPRRPRRPLRSEEARRSPTSAVDAGVPVLGRKGCSVTCRRWCASWCVAATTSTSSPPDRRYRAGRPRRGGVPRDRPPPRDDAAARERAAVAADAAAASRVRSAASRPGAVVYERYSLWSCEVIEAARDAGATTVLEVNAPLVTEQRRHRVLVDEATAVARTVRAVRAAHLPFAVSGPVARGRSGSRACRWQWCRTASTRRASPARLHPTRWVPGQPAR